MFYVLDSGRVDEDLSNSRLSLAVLSELRPIVADPCVVVEFAAFGKQMHRRIHETFAAREDREQGVTSDGRTSSGFGVPGPGIYDQRPCWYTATWMPSWVSAATIASSSA